MPIDVLTNSALVRIDGRLSAGLTALNTVATGGTIATTALSNKVTTAAAVTGVILQAGVQIGQIFNCIHCGAAANTITFAAAATSLVGGGTAVVITGPVSRVFTWDGTYWW